MSGGIIVCIGWRSRIHFVFVIVLRGTRRLGVAAMKSRIEAARERVAYRKP
jgi:hypothetical protein